MPGLPQQLTLPPRPISWTEEGQVHWTKNIHAALQQDHRQITETLNALLKTGDLIERTDAPLLDEILFYTTDEGILYIGVDGVWTPIGGDGLGLFVVGPGGVVITGSIVGGVTGTPFHSTVTATGNGQFLQAVIGEADDAGFDSVSMTGVTAQVRVEGVVTGSAWVSPLIAQNLGSQPAQMLIEANGPTYVGLDLTNIETQLAGTWIRAGVTMLGGDRVYLNATAGTSPGIPTSTGTTHIAYDSGTSSIVMTVGAVGALFANAGGVTVEGILDIDNGYFSLTGTGGSTTGASAPAFVAANKPGATAGAGPATWVKINIGGTDHWIPAWVD